MVLILSLSNIGLSGYTAHVEGLWNSIGAWTLECENSFHSSATINRTTKPPQGTPESHPGPSEHQGGVLIYDVLMVLDVILVFLGVVLMVLEVVLVQGRELVMF